MNLKPCPFCGKQDSILVRSLAKCLYIQCRHCSVEGPIAITKQAAIYLWNKREGENHEHEKRGRKGNEL